MARRYVRFADALDGVWLRGVPALTVRGVLKAWKHEIGSGSRFFVPQAFGDYRPLLISDPHHPFILARLAAEIDYHCEEVSGMRPLFHAVRDETLVSLIPDDSFETIARNAFDAVADSLPFESKIIVSPAGVPKIGGSKPSWAACAASSSKACRLGPGRFVACSQDDRFRELGEGTPRSGSGQVRSLLACCRGIAGSKISVDLIADCLQLTLLELGDADAAPAFGGADECGVDKLQDGALAKGMRDDFGAPARLAEQSLEQIGGADRSPMGERETQMCNAGLEVVVQTSSPRAGPYRRSSRCRRAADAPAPARPPDSRLRRVP